MTELKRVRMVIHQPRLNSVTEWVQPIEDLIAFGATVADAAVATRAENAPLVASDEGCKFCRAKAVCPALEQKVRDCAGDFENLVAADAAAQSLGGKAELHVGTDSNDDLAMKMAAVDLIEGWCKAVRAETERRLLAGDTVTGWKIVQGKRGYRQWTSKEEAEATLKAMRVPHDRMYDYSVVSPTTADKLAKEGVIGPRQWPKLQALITQAEGKPSVAPESDERPALSVDTTAGFADLTTTEI